MWLRAVFLQKFCKIISSLSPAFLPSLVIGRESPRIQTGILQFEGYPSQDYKKIPALVHEGHTGHRPLLCSVSTHWWADTKPTSAKLQKTTCYCSNYNRDQEVWDKYQCEREVWIRLFRLGWPSWLWQPVGSLGDTLEDPYPTSHHNHGCLKLQTSFLRTTD